MNHQRPPPLRPTHLNIDPNNYPLPPSPASPRFPPPPSPGMGRFPMSPSSNPNRRPVTPNSQQVRYPTSPIPHRRPTPPDVKIYSNPDRRPTPPHSGSDRNRRPTPPQSTSNFHSNPPRYPTPPHSASSLHSNPPRYPTPPYGPPSSRPTYQNTRSATMPNMPSRPPATLTPEQESLAKRLRGSFIANEEDAVLAEAEAKRNYDNLEAEMLMARKFRKDNIREKKKLEALMLDARERLTNLRPSWETARAANERLRAKEPEMARLREGLELDGEGFGEEERERLIEILREHGRQVAIAKEKWESVNAVKEKLIEEDKAVKDKDGRRQKHFNNGIEGHDKRRYAMRSRMARACHYTIYYAKRAHNYHIEREKLIPDPHFREALANLESTMQRAEGYLKGPIDEDSGERFWTMHASKSWWVKMPEGALGSPPSP